MTQGSRVDKAKQLWWTAGLWWPLGGGLKSGKGMREPCWCWTWLHQRSGLHVRRKYWGYTYVNATFSLPDLCCISKKQRLVLAMLDPLEFYVNFRMCPVSPSKKSISIAIYLEMNLRTDIFMSLLIRYYEPLFLAFFNVS